MCLLAKVIGFVFVFAALSVLPSLPPLPERAPTAFQMEENAAGTDASSGCSAIGAFTKSRRRDIAHIRVRSIRPY